MSATKKLDQDVQDIFSKCTIQGNVVLLPEGQLERVIYVKVDKALKALGGKWNRKLKGHVFSQGEDLHALLGQAIKSGEVIDKKQLFQFYETPRSLAERVVELAEIEEGMLVLEPSAGGGVIVNAVLANTEARDILAIELNNFCCDNMRNLFQYEGSRVTIIQNDFLETNPKPIFDRVVMNPPFTKGQCVKHILHALKCLKSGGRLVSIASPGIMFREQKLYKEVRAWIKRAGFYEENPKNSFKQSGTAVNTITIVVER